MNQRDRDALVMRHLERAYKACHAADSKAQGRERGDNELGKAILNAIAIMVRRGTPTTI